MHMVYNINNRMIYRGFHGDSAGKDKITKPDGKVVKGKWIYGCMAIIPMPVPDGAKPQMPILCLHSPERWGKSVGDSSIYLCTVSLFSGTWMDTNWEDALKADQRDWIARGKTSADWEGIPVFEGDIFWHKLNKKYYVIVYDLLQGFRLEPADGGDESLSWFFGLMRHKGTLWNPPKDFPEKTIKKFHAERSADARVEAIRF